MHYAREWTVHCHCPYPWVVTPRTIGIITMNTKDTLDCRRRRDCPSPHRGGAELSAGQAGIVKEVRRGTTDRGAH